MTRHCLLPALVWWVDVIHQSCITLSQGTEDTVCIPSSQALLLLMLLIPQCNLICSELVHSILLFKVSLIWEVLLMSADYRYWVLLMSADYRVHLHVFKKMQLQSSKSCMCVTSAEKFKRDRVEKCDLCFSILPSNLSVLCTGKYGGVGRGIESKKEHVSG